VTAEGARVAGDEQSFMADDLVEHGVRVLTVQRVPDADARLVAE
jgi:hypothetical protein